MKTDNNYLTKDGCHEIANKLLELAKGDPWDRFEFYTIDKDKSKLLVRFILVEKMEDVPLELKKNKK